MSYLSQSEIAASFAMATRVAQATAQETDPGAGDPDEWAQATRRFWAAQPGWSEAWESAQVSHGDEPGYDPGSDEAVITDGMILAAVQALLPA